MRLMAPGWANISLERSAHSTDVPLTSFRDILGRLDVVNARTSSSAIQLSSVRCACMISRGRMTERAALSIERVSSTWGLDQDR